ncbi:hypothetical protein E2C01_024285 [Portunus trituberculatus]|uniref:Uncharacterized protein n=1 Tax=Portunus trituberculatus TaxID=210409 RepID=A0A5B7EA57_PORTR|nr:hypothetical protein [Portunus trituberculatus]
MVCMTVGWLEFYLKERAEGKVFHKWSNQVHTWQFSLLHKKKLFDGFFISDIYDAEDAVHDCRLAGLFTLRKEQTAKCSTNHRGTVEPCVLGVRGVSKRTGSNPVYSTVRV